MLGRWAYRQSCANPAQPLPRVLFVETLASWWPGYVQNEEREADEQRQLRREAAAAAASNPPASHDADVRAGRAARSALVTCVLVAVLSRSVAGHETRHHGVCLITAGNTQLRRPRGVAESRGAVLHVEVQGQGP